ILCELTSDIEIPAPISNRHDLEHRVVKACCGPEREIFRPVWIDPDHLIRLRPIVVREGSSCVQFPCSITYRCDTEYRFVEAYPRHKAQVEHGTVAETREANCPDSFKVGKVASQVQIPAAVVRERHILYGIVEPCGCRKSKVHAPIRSNPHNSHRWYAFVEGKGTAHVYISGAITHRHDDKHRIIEPGPDHKILIHSPIRK